jgi:hypothetical protein
MHTHYNLPRTQASLCKKTVMRIWRVYMKYCSGERWRRGWWEECTWTARSLAVLGRFLARKSISCKLCYFVVVYDFCYLFLLNWLMLIFFCHLGVNSCCYSWYIWHMPYLKSMEIPILTCQPKRWRTRLAGTRFVSYNHIKVQTIKLHCCNKYFKLYGCELLFTWAFVYSIHLIEIAIGIVIDWSSLQLVVNTKAIIWLSNHFSVTVLY